MSDDNNEVSAEEAADIAVLLVNAVPEETDEGVVVGALCMMLNASHGEAMKDGDVQFAQAIHDAVKMLCAAFEARTAPTGPAH